MQVEKASLRINADGEGYFHREEKGEIMERFKSGLDEFLKRSIQTPVVNSHTVRCKAIAPADNPAEMEFNCSGA